MFFSETQCIVGGKPVVNLLFVITVTFFASSYVETLEAEISSKSAFVEGGHKARV